MSHGMFSSTEEQKNKDLFRAARGGDLVSVRNLLEEGANTNAKDNIGRTPLYVASEYGNTDVVIELLNRGADINDRFIGMTPLHVASQFGMTAVVAELLNRGADVNAKDFCGNTPLHVASFVGKTDVVVELLSRGVDANAKDNDGKTPLHVASNFGKTDVVIELLNRGADVNDRARMPLHVAYDYGRTPLRVALHDASAVGNTAEANAKGKWSRKTDSTAPESFDSGAHAYDKNYVDWTPLHVASKFGMTDVVVELLNRGADANAKDNYGKTPLHVASLVGKTDVVVDLLSRGADANAKDNYGKTPLHVASEYGNADVAAELLNRGADANAKDNYGKTPLHVASEYGNADVVIELLSRGADANAKDNYGKTPLYVASEFGKTDVVVELLNRGADVNAKNTYGKTPLYVASFVGKTDVVVELLSRGADANAKDKYGETPLHVASNFGKTDIVVELLKRGADVNAKDDDGETSLHFASRYGYKDIAIELLAHGADVNAKTKSDNTPLGIAMLLAKDEMIDLLEKACGSLWVGPLQLTKRPALAMLDLYHARTSKGQLFIVLVKLSQAFYRLSLEIQHLEDSPIKAHCKSIELSTFIVAVWEDEVAEEKQEGELVVVIQWTGGDSTFFFDYANSILREIDGQGEPDHDTMFPYHTVELPEPNLELKQYLQEEKHSSDEEANKIVEHIRMRMSKESIDLELQDQSWLRELKLWTDPRSIDPAVALSVGQKILFGDDCQDVQSQLLLAAFPEDEDRGGDLENDSIVALLVLAMAIEMLVTYESSLDDQPIVTQFLSLVTNKYLGACVLNTRQADAHPHVAFASVKLMRQLLAAVGLEALQLPERNDTEEAVMEALKFGRAHHAALENECTQILSTYFTVPESERKRCSFKTIFLPWKWF